MFCLAYTFPVLRQIKDKSTNKPGLRLKTRRRLFLRLRRVRRGSAPSIGGRVSSRALRRLPALQCSLVASPSPGSISSGFFILEPAPDRNRTESKVKPKLRGSIRGAKRSSFGLFYGSEEERKETERGGIGGVVGGEGWWCWGSELTSCIS